jgi:hypothetical protein
MAPRVVYDKPDFDARGLHGSVAAIVGQMIAATDGFDIRDAEHRAVVRVAVRELMPVWFETVMQSQSKLGKEDHYAE